MRQRAVKTCGLGGKSPAWFAAVAAIRRCLELRRFSLHAYSICDTNVRRTRLRADIPRSRPFSRFAGRIVWCGKEILVGSTESSGASNRRPRLSPRHRLPTRRNVCPRGSANRLGYCKRDVRIFIPYLILFGKCDHSSMANFLAKPTVTQSADVQISIPIMDLAPDVYSEPIS